jgi:polysaccharide export outer membrane protein
MAMCSALLVVFPVWCYGSIDPQAVDSQQKKANSAPVVASPKAAIPPATPTILETDPAKLAAPAAGARTPAPLGGKTYVIGAEDVLNILVWGNAPLTGDVTVRHDGMITLGLINEVRAAGLTPEQLTNEITARLTDGGFMQAPRVTVKVQQVNSRKACIVGEILKPGCFNLILPTTVLQALVNAGGFKDFANQKNIIVQRGEKRFVFNYKRVIAGKNREQNIFLEPEDLIIVK